MRVRSRCSCFRSSFSFALNSARAAISSFSSLQRFCVSTLGSEHTRETQAVSNTVVSRWHGKTQRQRHGTASELPAAAWHSSGRAQQASSAGSSQLSSATRTPQLPRCCTHLPVQVMVPRCIRGSAWILNARGHTRTRKQACKRTNTPRNVVRRQHVRCISVPATPFKPQAAACPHYVCYVFHTTARAAAAVPPCVPL